MEPRYKLVETQQTFKSGEIKKTYSIVAMTTKTKKSWFSKYKTEIHEYLPVEVPQVHMKNYNHTIYVKKIWGKDKLEGLSDWGDVEILKEMVKEMNWDGYMGRFHKVVVATDSDGNKYPIWWYRDDLTYCQLYVPEKNLKSTHLGIKIIPDTSYCEFGATVRYKDINLINEKVNEYNQKKEDENIVIDTKITVL